MVMTLTIQPISEAPVREGGEDLRPVLVAPGAFGEWTIACWDGRNWYDQQSVGQRRASRAAIEGAKMVNDREPR